MNKISDTRPDVRYGIFAGVGVIIFYSVAWLSFPRQAFGTATYYLSLLIYLICMFLSVNTYGKEAGAYLGFRQAAQRAFVVYMVANLFFYLFYWLMHELNPQIAEMQKADALENARHFYPKNELAERLRNLQKADFSVSFWSVLQFYVKSVIPAAFLSFLLAFVHWIRWRDE